MFFYGGTETFGGRRGKGKFVEVLPLTFKEYTKVLNTPYLPSPLKESLEKYFSTGGYLAVLNNSISSEDIILFLKNDLKILERSPEIGKSILGVIIEKSPSPLSYHAIANELGISTKTVMEYLEIFENMFLIFNAKFKSLDKKIKPRKERKYFFRDPFLAKSIGIWTGKSPSEASLYEWLIQEHMLRKFGEIYYWRNSYEIDCLAKNLKVEVKTGKPHRRYPKDVKILDKNNLIEFILKL